MNDFTLTADHLALAKRMYVGWNADAYYGAPEVSLKRPYGNSDVIFDVAELVGGWPFAELSDHLDYDSENEIKRLTCKDGRVLTGKELLALHREMDTALQIILCTQSFEPGTYRQLVSYDSLSWGKVDS